jgi:hypothetical protein
MGRKNNQQFVQIPTARLKERIAQLCEQYGICFLETEESYTSKASFVDGDFLPTLGEKPEGWKESGLVGSDGMIRTSSPPWNGVRQTGEFTVVVPSFNYSRMDVEANITRISALYTGAVTLSLTLSR